MSEPMDLIYKDPKYPSSKVVNGLSMAGPRAHLRGMGLVNEELAKPFIGVINTYNEMHPGHIHLNRIGQLVKDGVREAGGVPFGVNTISLCDGFSQGHVGMCSVLPSREVIADSIEVYAGGHQLDGLVLIGGCDKIVPAMIMAALRINLPTVLVTGGPMMPAVYKGKQYGTYELKEMAGKLTRGEISREEYEYMEGLMSPTPGSCAMMGTANTMSIIAEAMGLTMPGSACAHAVSGKKNRVAKESGMAVVRLVEEDIRPRDIVTQEMLELAEQRVAKLKARGYEHAGVYNPEGVGGTHVMYVLHHADQPELYHGLPKDPKIDTSVSLWKGALKPLAAAGFIATFAGLIFHYIGIGPNKEVDDDEEDHHE